MQFHFTKNTSGTFTIQWDPIYNSRLQLPATFLQRRKKRGKKVKREKKMYIFLHGSFYQKILRVCREHSRREKKWQHIRTLIVVDPEQNHPTCCPSLASYKDRKGYAFPFISFKETSGNDRYSGIKWNECCTVFSRHVMKWLMAKHRNPFRLLLDFGSNKMKPLNIGDLEPERPFSLWFVHRQIAPFFPQCSLKDRFVTFHKVLYRDLWN